jgi:hypothetical protein
MPEKNSLLLFASAATLSLALSQAALAQTEAVPAPTAPAPAAPVAATAPDQAPAVAPAATQEPAAAAPAPVAIPAAGAPAAVAAEAIPAAPSAATDAAAARGEAARQRMEERHAEMMAKRRERYEDLRKRAEAAGLSLPETPPWEEGGMAMPEMPEMPGMPQMPGMPEMPMMPSWGDQAGMGGMGDPGAMGQGWDARRPQRWPAMDDRAAQRGGGSQDQAPWNLMSAEEHRAHWEKMRNASPEERAALREQHWAEMRERAAAAGMTLPETPPWKEAEQRREARQAQWETYRKIIDQMSTEQREAAAAIFGQPPQPPQPAGRDMPWEMNPPMPQMPRMPQGQDFGAPSRMPYPQAMPGYGGNNQPMPWSGNPAPRQGPMMMPKGDYNRW